MSKILQGIFIFFTLIFMSGCGMTISNELLYSENSSLKYNKLVDDIEINLKKCFSIKASSYQSGLYIVREDYQRPKYSRLTIYIDNQMDGIPKYLGMFTIFNDEKVKVQINQIKLPVTLGVLNIGKLDKWYIEGMECKNDKK
ncbi:hypothetical protein [Arcobacter sp.]|uniref:hypothetical protein n=1 Tax=unclassified Arcobacter TaxID=2593671 RepID=UPI003B0062EC